MVYVLDISGHQGDVDFEKVKKAGIYGVMLKCSEGDSYLAPKFQPNYQKALAAGLKVGAYHFMRAAKAADAAAEGRWFAKCVAGLDLALGAALDIEHEGVNWDGVKLSAGKARELVQRFWQEFGAAANTKWLYASKDYFLRFLHHDELAQYPRWLANPSRLAFDLPLKMLQYSWEGEVAGVPKAVDLNVLWEESELRQREAFLEHPLSFAEKKEQLLYRIRGHIGEKEVELELLATQAE